jgi:hypothetical protein
VTADDDDSRPPAIDERPDQQRRKSVRGLQDGGSQRDSRRRCHVRRSGHSSVCSPDLPLPLRFTTPATGKSSSTSKAAGQQVSLIDFDFDEAPPAPASTSAPSNPADDLAGLGALFLGSTSPTPYSTGPSQSQGSLFDLSPSTFSSPSVQSFPNNSTPSVPGAGSYFSNPSYRNGNGPDPASSSSSTLPINWGTNSGASTSATAGSIQLGAAGTRMGMAAAPPAQKNGKAKDPFDDLLL